MNRPDTVLGRAIALLRAISEHEPHGATTTALAQRTGLPRPTAHRLLSSLLVEGLSDRDSSSGVWHLGPETYLLGVAAGGRHDETEAARACVRRLAHTTGESAFFSVLRGDETVCLIREDGSFPIRSHVLHEGIRFPLGVASAGLVTLAYLSGRERETYLGQTDLTDVFGARHAPDQIWERIDQTRQQGYAVNPGLIVPGSWGLAAAVFDAKGTPRWALSLTGVEARLAPPRQQELGELLLLEAHRLTTAIDNRQRGPSS